MLMVSGCFSRTSPVEVTPYLSFFVSQQVSCPTSCRSCFPTLRSGKGPGSPGLQRELALDSGDKECVASNFSTGSRAPGAGAGAARGTGQAAGRGRGAGGLLRASLLRASGTQRPPPVSRSRGRAVREEGPWRPGRREAGGGGGGPAASAAPSPGVSARDTPSPGSGRWHRRRRRRRRRRRQAVTSPELRRGTQPPPAGGGRGQRRGSSAAGPGNRLRLQRCSGTDTDPRGRHDGLGAAPQRGQAPPPTPPPATSGARLAGTRALPAPLSGTLPCPSPRVSLPARTWPSTTF
eukprot:XP_022279646.1 serine/arginine repetitive matrix protein 3-like [Canis lupus familiaris]